MPADLPASLMAHQGKPATPRRVQRSGSSADCCRGSEGALTTSAPKILDLVHTAVPEPEGARKVSSHLLAQHAPDEHSVREASGSPSVAPGAPQDMERASEKHVAPAFPPTCPGLRSSPSLEDAVRPLDSDSISSRTSSAAASQIRTDDAGIGAEQRTGTAIPTAARTQSGHQTASISSVRLPDDGAAAAHVVRPSSDPPIVSEKQNPNSARQLATRAIRTPRLATFRQGSAEQCDPGMPMALPNTPAAEAAVARGGFPRSPADLASSRGAAFRPAVVSDSPTAQADSGARAGAPLNEPARAGPAGEWSTTELGAFKLGVYLFGRELRRVQRLVGTKTVSPHSFSAFSGKRVCWQYFASVNSSTDRRAWWQVFDTVYIPPLLATKLPNYIAFKIFQLETYSELPSCTTVQRGVDSRLRDVIRTRAAITSATARVCGVVAWNRAPWRNRAPWARQPSTSLLRGVFPILMHIA